MELELRMYSLVLYQLSGTIHAGIQAYHSTIEATNQFDNPNSINEELFKDWSKNWKTVIILSGGSSITMKDNYEKLYENGIGFSSFFEPDLGDQLTSVSFLVDERVFLRDLYKNFEPETIPLSKNKPSEKQLKELETINANNYLAWVDSVGGVKNVFLRDFLKNFKLA